MDQSLGKSGEEKVEKGPGSPDVAAPGQPFSFVWTIDHWSEVKDDLFSPDFYVEDMKFNIKLCKMKQPNQFLSIKVYLGQTPKAPKTLIFQVLLRGNNASKTVLKKQSKAYSKINAYDTFMLTQMKNINEYLVDDTLTITITHPISSKAPKAPKPQTEKATQHYVPQIIVEAPPPVLPPPVSPAQQSKELTGYVGLRNQGATCYMNSLLQSLFHLPAFRRIVYAMPTTGAESVTTSIPLNLQRLFCQMQFSKSPVSTSDLTTSFGWRQRETMQQQDVQEFCRVLLDNLEQKLRGTNLESSIENLFTGHTRTYIQCKNVNYRKNIDEGFKDLSLLVKGCKSLRESLLKELEPQIMDSLYETDEYGKQEALMGQEFLDFPSILHIHLRRFDRDIVRNTCVKINDKFEFPVEIDMGEFLSPKRKSIYDLHGVLVHSGGSMCGHYYAYLRTTQENQWYKFYDQIVTKVDSEEAIENNYGGIDENGHDRTFSGYMLIYVRRDDVPTIFEAIKNETVPLHLREFFAHISQSRLGVAGPVEVKLATESNIAENCLTLTTGFDGRTIPLTVSKAMTLSQLYDAAASATGTDRRAIRLWRCAGYSIPRDVVPDSEKEAQSMMQTGAFVFVQSKPPEEAVAVAPNRVVVFLKYFFPGDDFSMVYFGSAALPEDMELSALKAMAAERIGLPPETPLLVFQETIQRGAMRVTAPRLFESGINHGAVLIFQIDPSAPEQPTPTIIEPIRGPPPTPSMPRSQSFPSAAQMPILSYVDAFPEASPVTVDQYMEHCLHSMKAFVCNVTTPSSPAAALKFPANLKWSSLKAFIARACALEYNPERDSMRLFRRDEMTMGPMNVPINGRLLPSMSAVIAAAPSAAPSGDLPVIYFQLFKGIPENANNSMSSYVVQFSRDAVAMTANTRLLMPKECTVREIAAEMEKRGLMPHTEGMRAIAISYHRVLAILDLDKGLPFPDATIRFEPTPADQMEGHVVPIVRGYVDRFDIPHLTSDPFLMRIDDSEALSAVLERAVAKASLLPNERATASITVTADKKVVPLVEGETAGTAAQKGTLMLVETKPQKFKSITPCASGAVKRSTEVSVRILN